MFSRLISNVMVLCANVLDVYSTDYVSFISAAANVAVGTDGVLRYPPQNRVDEYISQYVPRLDARRFAMMPVGQARLVELGSAERETAYMDYSGVGNIGVVVVLPTVILMLRSWTCRSCVHWKRRITNIKLSELIDRLRELGSN